jgi:hypothetical protein
MPEKSNVWSLGAVFAAIVGGGFGHEEAGMSQRALGRTA